MSGRYPLRIRLLEKGRHQRQFRKILTYSKTEDPPLRSDMELQEESDLTPRIKDSRHFEDCEKNSQGQAKLSHSKIHSPYRRQADGSFHSLSSRPLQETSSQLRSSNFSQGERDELGRSSHSWFSLSKVSSVLLKPPAYEKVQWKTIDNLRSHMDHHNRCLTLRLGCNNSPQTFRLFKIHKGPVLTRRRNKLFKLERNQSSSVGSMRLQRSHSQRPWSLTHPVGQYHRSILLEEVRRRHSISSGCHRSPTQVHHSPQSARYLLSHSRTGEYSCRSFIEKQTKRARLQSLSSNVLLSRSNIRSTLTRLVRLSDQQPNIQVRKLVSRSSGYLQRRLFSRLEPGKLLCLSAHPAHQKSNPSFLQLTSLTLNNSCNPSLAERHFVASSPSSIDSRSHTSSSGSDISGHISSFGTARLQDEFHSIPSSILEDIQGFILESNSSSASRSKTYKEFKKFLLDQNLPDDELSFVFWIKSQVLPKTTSAQTVQTKMSHIDVSRRIERLLPFQGHPIVTEFKKAVKKRLPRSTDSSFLDIIHVLSSLPPPILDPVRLSLRHLDKKVAINFTPSIAKRIHCKRLRCLILTRSVALLRSIDCATILRSSIRVSRDLKGRRILIFTYCGKSASIYNVSSESNYLEFLPNHSDLCPASAMITLKKQIDLLKPPHDFLFCSERRPIQESYLGATFIDRKRIFSLNWYS